MLRLIAQSSGGSPLTLLLPFLLLGGLFYFMILRPQQRRQRAQQELLNAIDVGDEVVTTQGIFGTITSIDEDEGTVTLQIAPGTEVKLLRAGIGRRLTADEDEFDDEVDDDEADGDEDHPDQPGQIKER